MTRIFIVVAICVAFLSPAWASNPGEPLGGEDFVLVLPGLVAKDYLPPHVGRCNDDPNWKSSDTCAWERGNSVDVEGNVFVVNRAPVGTGQFCGGTERRRFEIHRLDQTGSRELVAYLDDRCAPGMGIGIDLWDWVQNGDEGRLGLDQDPRFNFDPYTGTLRFRLRTQCAVCSFPSQVQDKIVAISGFATTFEILQTYTPPSGPISFRVPYMPEGFQFADSFDTYYGDLATVGDWSQLQPLKCGYPASPPSVGDYLTVADPLPSPSPGQGYYYVTAVNYQGEQRYGRKRAGGVTSGRDPAVLPACPESSLEKAAG